MSGKKKGFKKGFSLMDWNRVSETAKKWGERKDGGAITMDEVAKHSTEYDGWTVFDGRVYNLTPYLHYHPGGVDVLLPMLGKDCTYEFKKAHRWINGHAMLRKCLIGMVEGGRPPTPVDEDDEDESDDDGAF
mmetsp:Transcript_20739/g.65221  ORF Transcript_20739/g.65221 Transcript_20739/m.65221 type:complete len:132 (-) Transcript_20739:25-420(-)